VRGERFRALHHQPGAFIIPNPWDAGSARLLTQIGFDALASTGAGCAFSAGQPDGSVGRDAMLAHLRALAEATDLPISADLQDGFGDEPDVVAETIELVAACGIVGGSIEDRSYRPGADLLAGRALHDLGLAVERIQAASEAARRLPFAFTLTARCEGSVAGQADLDHVVRRLLAYQDAGADVLYAPGLTGRDEIAAVVAAVDRPVNVVMGLVGDPLALDELSELGVKRVSLGSTLCRVALGALMRAARELRDAGTFTFASEAIGYTTVNRLLAGAAGASG
jgi:2-methylisocitrate lyase-like PEP mutase family enzyme